MLKRKENKNNSKGKKSQLIIVGSLLIIVGIVMVGGKYLYTYLLDKKEDIKIEEFYEVQEKIDDELKWKHLFKLIFNHFVKFF